MIKIYGSREEEARLLAYLVEFKVRAVVNYPIKGKTRKIRKQNLYKIIYYPI